MAPGRLVTPGEPQDAVRLPRRRDLWAECLGRYMQGGKSRALLHCLVDQADDRAELLFRAVCRRQRANASIAGKVADFLQFTDPALKVATAQLVRGSLV